MNASSHASRAGASLLPFPSLATPRPAERVRAVIVGDAAGEVQVIVPEQALLDLPALTAATGRPLRARPWQDEACTPAVPGACGLPVIIEHSLVGRSELALATSEPGEFVGASGAQLLAAAPEAVVVECARPLASTGDDSRASDLARIEHSLSEFTERRLLGRLDEVLSIPPLPEAARRIVALQSAPDFDLGDLVDIVETDPSIAARIMGWANSAFYGARPPVSGVADAVMRVLGFDTVMSMALGMSLGQTLRLPEAQVRGLPDFWLEGVFTAACMEALARRLPAAERPVSGLCYLAGLLANFGTLVVGHVFPPQYATICAMQEVNRHLPHTFVDEQVLQLPRELLAAALLECWSLPEPVIDAVRFQHVHDYAGENASYVRLLGIARRLLGLQGLCDEPPLAPSAAELAAVGLTPEDIARVLELMSESAASFGELAGSFGG